VQHAWGNTFVSLVEAVVSHALGGGDIASEARRSWGVECLEAELEARRPTHYYWIDLFCACALRLCVGLS
jgi:hypothetical protein